MLSRSTESLAVGGDRFKRVVTLCFSLTFSVHVCELRICKFGKSLVACSIRHVRFDSFFHPTQVFSRTVEVTIFDRPRQLPHVNSHNSLPRPIAALRSTKTDHGGADGWQPKSPLTASGRGNQPAGNDLESNRGCPGPHDIKRDVAINWNIGVQPLQLTQERCSSYPNSVREKPSTL